MDPRVVDRLIVRIREGRSFVVSSHARIDGDGLASALALDFLLRGMGKRSAVIMPGTTPYVFRNLPGADRVVSLEDTPGAKAPGDVDTFIAVDVADIHRLGGVPKLLPKDVFTVSIDHHRTGDFRADVDCDDPKASSTGELIYALFKRGKFPFTPEIAHNIYVAVMTDTQRFSLPNTSALCLKIAGEMVEAGADPGLIGVQVYRSFLPGQLTLWGEVASRVKIDCAGRLAWTVLTDEMLARHKVHADDTQDFADIPRMLSGVEVGVLFREFAGGVRVSLRSNHIPILSVAESFGGGGHALACGCELECKIDEAQKQVLDALRKLISAA
jgi:phosphoesterase RecJ-like protein